MINRPATNVSALLVYVSALLAGGLHHHEAFAASDSVNPNRQVGAATDSEFDDGHDCVICQAISQAKIQPPAQHAPAIVTFSRPVTVLPCDSPRLARHNATQARAPPL